MFTVIHERQAMKKKKAYGFSEVEAATPVSLNRVFSSHICVYVYIYIHTCTLLKHSSKKACNISMRLGFSKAAEKDFTSSLTLL